MPIEPLHVCTVVTRSYVPLARTLAHSLKKHHPDSVLWVLIPDQFEKNTESEKEPFKTVLLKDLPNQKIIEPMCFYYTAIELCCAVRGELHEFMRLNVPASRWLFLDPDVYVTAPLHEILREFERSSILLTPHFNAPFPSQHAKIGEIRALAFGIYNGGFIGLKKDHTGRAFIEWYRSRLPLYAMEDPEHSQYTDQLLLNYVPVFFENTVIFRHAGMNVARWNLHERALAEETPGNFSVNGKPLLFCHFSRFNPENPASYAVDSQRFRTEKNSTWKKLAEEYAQKVLGNGFLEMRKIPYAFNYFKNGKKITTAMRRVFYEDYFLGRAGAAPFGKGVFYDRMALEMKFIIRKLKRFIKPRGKFRPT